MVFLLKPVFGLVVVGEPAVVARKHRSERQTVDYLAERRDVQTRTAAGSHSRAEFPKLAQLGIGKGAGRNAAFIVERNPLAGTVAGELYGLFSYYGIFVVVESSINLS